MKSYELNQLLIKEFSNLKEDYIEEVGWQEGDDTGSHIVYGDVFTPYLKECIELGEMDQINRGFEYVESVLELNDTYANEVIAFSVLESIAYLFKGNQSLHKFLGGKTKEVIKVFF